MIWSQENEKGTPTHVGSTSATPTTSQLTRVGGNGNTARPRPGRTQLSNGSPSHQTNRTTARCLLSFPLNASHAETNRRHRNGGVTEPTGQGRGPATAATHRTPGRGGDPASEPWRATCPWAPSSSRWTARSRTSSARSSESDPSPSLPFPPLLPPMRFSPPSRSRIRSRGCTGLDWGDASTPHSRRPAPGFRRLLLQSQPVPL